MSYYLRILPGCPGVSSRCGRPTDVEIIGNGISYGQYCGRCGEKKKKELEQADRRDRRAKDMIQGREEGK